MYWNVLRTVTVLRYNGSTVVWMKILDMLQPVTADVTVRTYVSFNI